MHASCCSRSSTRAACASRPWPSIRPWAANVGSATLAVGNQRVPLEFIGAARSLREQALPLGFRAQGAALNSLAVGQPVRVFVQTKEKVKGMAVPVASLMKNPANQTIVWVKTAPERFEPAR
jgi:cobalt-zinc-cadmium efflux system membrane fusion protein